ncbi:MAG: hypothetical protein Alpg2KO_28760 [Alphaproteobacteria bacterium]
MSYSLILLDFDGTLAATEPVGWGNISRVLGEHFGVDQQQMHDFVCTRHGQTIEQYYPDLCRQLGREIDPNGAEQVKRAHTETLLPLLRQGIPPAGQLVSALRSLSEQTPCRFCVTSNSVLPRLEASMDGMEAHTQGAGQGLRDLLSGIYSAQRFKPDPEVFLTAIQAQTDKPDHVVVVEDSGAGMKAGAALRDHCDMPVHLIGTTALRDDPYAGINGLMEAGADVVIAEDDWTLIAREIMTRVATADIS